MNPFRSSKFGVASFLGALALAVVFISCGEQPSSEDGGAATTTSRTAASASLMPCPAGGDAARSGSGANWNASVAGISCNEVGVFIQQQIFPRAGDIPTSSKLSAAGFDCSIQDLRKDGSLGGWHLVCEDGDQQFDFDWTP